MTPRNLTPRADLPTLVEGDDYTFAVSFTDRSGDPIDITDWTVSMTIADQQTSGGTPIVERDITTHDDAMGGKTSWDLPGSETAGTTGTKRYDIQVVKSDGTTRTVALGTVGFLDGATDRPISGSGGGAGANATAGASINVTLDGDDSISLSIQGLTNYTDSDAVAAVDGSSLQSLSLGELSVNGNTPVTAVAGTTGEFVHRKSFSFPNDYTTTSTSYDTKFGDAVPFDIGFLPITNANDIYISVAADIDNSTEGETTTFSIRSIGTDYGKIQLTGTTSEPVVSSRVPFNETGIVRLNPQLKVTGGEGDVEDISVDFWVEVGT